MADDSGRRKSSRQAKSSAKDQRKMALEELRNARLSGKTYRRDTGNMVQDVYTTVTEEEYDEIQKRRAHENFVEDDDGTGYYDDGTIDDFDEYDDEENEQPSSSKSKHKSRKDEQKKKTGPIHQFFSVKSNDKESENAPCNLEEDPDMLNMLNQLDQSYADGGSENPAFSFGANNFAESVNAQQETQNQSGATLSWPSKDPFDEVASKSISVPHNEKKRPASAMSDNVPALKMFKMGKNKKKAVEVTSTEIVETMQEPSKSPVEPVIVEAKQDLTFAKPEIETVPVAQDELAEQAPMFLDHQFEHIDNFEDVEMETEQKETNEQPADADVLRMYWTETFEDLYKNAGSVYLFGKVNGQSCCVLVRNIEHKVYFLPRKLDGDSDQNLAEVRDELVEKFKNDSIIQIQDAKNKAFRSSYETIKWIPTDEQVPREVRALMVLYKGYLPKIPPKTTGKTFGHVLNTTATAMERLLLEAKLRGPCWIDISNAVESKKKLSHCDLEYIVDLKTAGSYNVKTANITKPSPFVNLLALNFVSVPSSDSKETELIMISGLYRSKGLLDRANNRSQQAYETFCFMTNPRKGVIPLTFDAQLKFAKINPESVKKFQNERVLLNSFFAKLKQLDPDIIILHDAPAQISLLISRVEKYTIRTWSFLSRLNQHQTPGRLSKTKAGQWELMAGRSVLCSKTASEELYPTKSYELGDLVTLLMPEASHISLTFDQISEVFTATKSALSVSQLIQWSWLEAYFALQIVLQLNALPLFVQITQIVGGVLSRTLLGGRSERNEYLLLHAFYESGYVPPDKHQFTGTKKGNKALKDETNSYDDDTKAGTSRKAQYTGGLVLEPKKGFYDSYIVLLDFNSLYPSIIQEFNICFTTIDRCYEEPDEKGLPDPPKDSVPEGILSIEIGNLVRNRRDVKFQMQKAKPGTDEYMRLDVRQKGLKLTANSMYGCLGFGMSRFCAKTLAAMITSKGRELLSRTKDMVEKRGYTVVYGDTDSIMVNTNTAIYADACRLAFELRKIVNGGFKHVEMDVDGLFKRLLLLKKKKYAALAVSLKSETAVKREMKGLDIVRRDWSKLAKDVGERVVDLILNSKEREELVDEVVKTLGNLVENLKAGNLPMEDFEILKQLTKAPKDYVDIKNQPHVVVAQRLNTTQGFHLHQGDVIKYVICQDGTNNSAVQRAYHLSELANNKDLVIDSHYYLSQQVHPVVMRLCAPFNELDSGRIAEALGLDATGYRSQAANRDADFTSFEMVTDASADFDLCEGFQFECPDCKNAIVVRSPFNKQGMVAELSLEKCSECQCDLVKYYEELKSRFIIQLNAFIKKHTDAKFVCDDPTCAYQEDDSLGLNWTSNQGPMCPQCKSNPMRKEFSLRDLFYQQKFFLEHIFNVKDRKYWADKKKDQELQIYDDCKKLAHMHLNANRFNRVNLGQVLSGFRRKV